MEVSEFVLCLNRVLSGRTLEFWNEYNNTKSKNPKFKALATKSVRYMAMNRNPAKRFAPIPKLIHQIWLENPLPDEFKPYMDSWKRDYPDYEYKLWGDDDDYTWMKNYTEFMECPYVSSRSDLLRHALLEKFGGLYADCDQESLKNAQSIIDQTDWMVGSESKSPMILSVGFIACVPNHPFSIYLNEYMPDHAKLVGDQRNCAQTTGPGCVTALYERYMLDGGIPVTIHNPDYFYPYSFYEKDRKGEFFPHAYSVHHWAHSWDYPHDPYPVEIPPPKKVERKGCGCGSKKGKLN